MCDTASLQNNDKVASYNHSGYKKNLFLNFILSAVVASGGDVALRKVRRLHFYLEGAKKTNKLLSQYLVVLVPHG